MNAFFVERIEENPLDGLRRTYVIENFVDEELPLPVRVTRVDDGNPLRR